MPQCKANQDSLDVIIDPPKPHRILESTWGPSDRNVSLYMVHTCSGDIAKAGMSTDWAVRVREKQKSHGAQRPEDHQAPGLGEHDTIAPPFVAKASPYHA